MYEVLLGEEEEEEIPEVDVRVVEPDAVRETLGAVGTLRASREVELRTEVPGILTELLIEEGSRVEQGQLLARINDNDLQAELRGVQYELEVVSEAAQRLERLVAEGGTTRDALDEMLIRVNELRASRENLLAQLERREIRAPFAGVVGLTFADEGSYLTSDTRLATLQDIDSMRLEFTVPERHAATVGFDTPVFFEVQGTDSVYEAQVGGIEPRVDPRTRSIRIRATSANEDGRLRPGAFANVQLVLAARERAVTVPSLAVVPDAGSHAVFVFREGRAMRQPVELGIRLDDRVEVVDGLAHGDTVVVNGLHRLQDGVAVRIRETAEDYER